MSEILQPKPCLGPQLKVIRFPSISSMTCERAPDETGSFAKSNMDALKILKGLTGLKPFSGRSREEVMEFICYMFEVQGQPGLQVCKQSERDHNFYFIASGELLHNRFHGGGHQKQQMEQKLYEHDYWGLECLFTGKNERVAVTVTTQCRLFVLTARRFFWLCKTSAQRTFQLQTGIIHKLARELVNVQTYVGAALPEETETVGLPKRPLVINLGLKGRILESFRQVEVPSSKDPLPPIEIFCLNGESIIVYALSGCAKLTLERCANYRGPDPESNILLQAGEFHEIEANQEWQIRQGSRAHAYPTIVYLIKLKQAKLALGSTIE